MNNSLREETRYVKGSEVMSKIHGKCRIRCILEKDGLVSVVLDKRPVDYVTDFWMKVVDGEIVDFEKPTITEP